ncbi:MAG TPA: tetratricopeptide repeat protein, partial [Candidatus Polarisedimenticolia bacterium]|nr:tetratricopeptide repeat protein [Candidatus Polarisedimenticolia bacterium]
MRKRIQSGEAEAVDAEARRFLAELEKSGAAESRLTADLLNILSLALVAEGKAADPEALAVTTRNLALTERLVGTEDLLYARALTDHGWTAFQAGDFATARPYLERSLALRQRLLGPDDPSVGRALMNLGGVVLRS